MCRTCAGRAAVKEAMGICDAVPMKGHAWHLINWAATPFSLFAEGSYPFPCNYLTNGGGSLPAYPMRVACNTFLSQPMNGTDLLAGTKRSHILIPVGIACFLSDEDVCGCDTKQETWSALGHTPAGELDHCQQQWSASLTIETVSSAIRRSTVLGSLSVTVCT